jgi:ribosomal protein L11 methyltransferase
MYKVFSRIHEKYVNPLFEVFDGGDFVLSSYRDIESDMTDVQLYFAEEEKIDEAKRLLSSSLSIVGVDPVVHTEEVEDEDWKYSYRKFFTTHLIGDRLLIRPPWDPLQETNRTVVTLDPGLAFGTGKHETTRACLEYVEMLSSEKGDFLDMGCGSGILSIAASLLGFTDVKGFDVDQEAVDSSIRNAEENNAKVEFFRFGLGAGKTGVLKEANTVVANILGPLLIRFADEICPVAKKNLVISGILDTLYVEVLSEYVKRGFKEVSRKTIGEWTTGLLVRAIASDAN